MSTRTNSPVRSSQTGPSPRWSGPSTAMVADGPSGVSGGLFGIRALCSDHACCSSPRSRSEVHMAGNATLEGEIAIVTGGARGIGKAVVEVFVANGASVVFCDLDPDLGKPIEEALGDQTRFVTADVSSETDIAAVADACTRAF